MKKLLSCFGIGIFAFFVLCAALPHPKLEPAEMCGDGKAMMAKGFSRDAVEKFGACNSKVRQGNYDTLYRAQHGE